MRPVLPLLCVALIGACHASSGDNGVDGPTPTDVVSLLKSGDAKVCMNALVQQNLERALVSSTIMGEPLYNKMIAAGRHLTFDAVSMSSRNRDISEMRCSATLISGAFKVPIDYTLRPEASGEKFILSWTSDNPVEIVQGAIVSAVPLSDNVEGATVPTAPSNLEACADGNSACSPEQYDALCNRGENWACEPDTSDEVPAGEAYDQACADGKNWACEHIKDTQADLTPPVRGG